MREKLSNNKIEKLAKKYVKQVQKVFGMEHHHITIRLRYRKKEEGWCRALGEYEEAVININPERVTGKGSLRKTILHEMIHVLHAKFETLAESLVSHYKKDDAEVMEKVLEREKEALVCHTARILYPLVWRE